MGGARDGCGPVFALCMWGLGGHTEVSSGRVPLEVWEGPSCLGGWGGVASLEACVSGGLSAPTAPGLWRRGEIPGMTHMQEKWKKGPWP